MKTGDTYKPQQNCNSLPPILPAPPGFPGLPRLPRLPGLPDLGGFPGPGLPGLNHEPSQSRRSHEFLGVVLGPSRPYAPVQSPVFQKQGGEEQAGPSQTPQNAADLYTNHEQHRGKLPVFRRIARHSLTNIFEFMDPETNTRRILKVGSRTIVRNEYVKCRHIEKSAVIADWLARGPSLLRPPFETVLEEDNPRGLVLTLPVVPRILRHLPPDEKYMEEFNKDQSAPGGSDEQTECESISQSALVMERIPNLPELYVERMLRYRYPGNGGTRQQVRQNQTVDDGSILLKPLFGLPHAITGISPYDAHVPLTDFPGDLDLLEALFPRYMVRHLACRVALFLAYLHWAARYDGAGIEFVLGGKAINHGSGNSEQVEMYCVGFRKCQNLTSWSAIDVQERLVPAVLKNHPFIPRPGSEDWAAWEETYLEASMLILAAAWSQRDSNGRHLYSFQISDAQKLPEIFIRGLELALRAQDERQNADVAEPTRKGIMRHDSTSHEQDAALEGDDGVSLDGRRDACNAHRYDIHPYWKMDVRPRHRELDSPKSICVTPASKRKRKVCKLQFAEHNTASEVMTMNLHCLEQLSTFRGWLKNQIAQEIRKSVGKTPPGLLFPTQVSTSDHPQRNIPPEPLFDGRSEYFSVRTDDAATGVVEWGTRCVTIKAGPSAEICKEYHRVLLLQSRAVEAAAHLTNLPLHALDHATILPTIPKPLFFVNTRDELFANGTTLFGMPLAAGPDTSRPNIHALELQAAGFAMDLPPGHGRLVRQMLVHGYYQGDLSMRMSILESPRNRVCLIQPLLGADKTVGQPYDESTPLFDFPGCTWILSRILPNPTDGLKCLSSQMGAFYAALHWYMGFDGRGIKFLLDESLELHVFDLGWCENFGFDLQERNMLPQKRMEIAKRPVRDKLVPAVVENAPFIPRPGSQLFDKFQRTYVCMSMILFNCKRSRWAGVLTSCEVLELARFFIEELKAKLGKDSEMSQTERSEEECNPIESEHSDPNQESADKIYDAVGREEEPENGESANDGGGDGDGRPCKQRKP